MPSKVWPPACKPTLKISPSPANATNSANNRGAVRPCSPSHSLAISPVTMGDRPNSTETQPEGMNWADQ